MPEPVPRVQIVPQTDDAVSFQVDGAEHVAAFCMRQWLLPYRGDAA
jgi:hypothetical protein